MTVAHDAPDTQWTQRLIAEIVSLVHDGPKRRPRGWKRRTWRHGALIVAATSEDEAALCAQHPRGGLLHSALMLEHSRTAVAVARGW